MISFTALVKAVNIKALVSGDKSIRIILETEDLRALELGTAPADNTVTVEIS